MKINKLCRRKRREMELSQSRLAEYIGVNQSTIASFESGRSGVSTKTLDKILNTLGIELE